MRPSAAPLVAQFAILILGPPIMASLIWMMSRGWAHTAQGVAVSDRTKSRQRAEFWVVMAIMYAIGFGMAVYAWLT